jgi:hypothetical protein
MEREYLLWQVEEVTQRSREERAQYLEETDAVIKQVKEEKQQLKVSQAVFNPIRN